MVITVLRVQKTEKAVNSQEDFKYLAESYWTLVPRSLSAEHTSALDVALKTLNSLKLVVCHRSLEQIHVSRF